MEPDLHIPQPFRVRSSNKQFLAYLCIFYVFASGAAGLAHQLIWSRRLVDLLGASGDTFAKVTGAFFLGLALGGILAARSRKFLTWKAIGLAELSVGLLSVIPLFSYSFAPVHPVLIPIIPFLLIIPPSAAMGIVIPALINIVASHGSSARLPVVLYAINTCGAVFGILGVLLFLLPKLGVTGAGLLVCGINIFLALTAWLASYCFKPKKAPKAQPIAEPLITSRFVYAASFISGFVILAAEGVLQHQIEQVAINSIFSNAAVLIVVLLSLTLSAFLLPLIRRIPHKLFFLMAGVAVFAAIEPLFLHRLRPNLSLFSYELPRLTYTWQLLKTVFILGAPFFFFSGFLFPLLIDQATDKKRMGYIFAWNGIGAWLGAELAQVLFLPLLGLWSSFLVLGLISFTLGIASILHALSNKLYFRPLALACSGVVVMALLIFSFRLQDLPQTTMAQGQKVAKITTGREGTVAVVTTGPRDWRILFNNSYTLGGSTAAINQERQAHLPLLLHAQPRSICLLGIATGSSLAGASLHTNLSSIDAVELSPLVLSAARTYFAPFNRGAFEDPRVRTVEGDARTHLLQKNSAYDVIIGDLFLPWRTGEGRMYSTEHFIAIRNALRPGGIYCQWLPMYQLTQHQYHAICRTLRKIFPDTFIIRGDFYAELPIIGLVAGKSVSELDWKKIELACSSLASNSQVNDPIVRHSQGIAMMIVGDFSVSSAGPINTLGNSWLEWEAGRNILGLGDPWFIGVPIAEYLQSTVLSAKQYLPPAYHAPHDSGQFFLTLEIAAKLNLPILDNFLAQVSERIPSPLRQDTNAAWQYWPMRVKPTFHNN